ncbi:hypothetical protein LTR85_002435 [Meristemomyces frigidus]|nr:hypothetical protein LTR85_002435 [Meristemomyces frigidus]
MYLTNMISLVIFSIVALAVARPQWQGGSDPSHQPNKDGPSPEIPGSARVCTGPNLSGSCFTAPECVAKCWVWTSTWEWAESFDSDTNVNCYLYSGPECDGDGQLVPDGGYSSLSAVGWLDKMESFQCVFAFRPDGDMKDSHATAAAPASPAATSKLPLVMIPIGNQTRLSSTVTSTTQATATPTHHVIPTRDTRDLEKRNAGSVYICTESNIAGACSYVTHEIGTCYSMQDWNPPAAAFGPDLGATCYIFHNYTCDDDITISVVYPGLPDIQNDGYPYTVGSWYCNYSSASREPSPVQQTSISATFTVPVPTASAVADTIAEDGTYGVSNSVSARTTASNVERGIPGGCYICSEPNWGGECDYVYPQIGTCYSMKDWSFDAESYGPDEDATCYIFNSYDCTTTDGGSIPVHYPGLTDVVVDVQANGYPFVLGSWYCLSTLLRRDSAPAEVGGTEEEPECCSATVVLASPTTHVARPGGPLPTMSLTGVGAGAT